MPIPTEGSGMLSGLGSQGRIGEAHHDHIYEANAERHSAFNLNKTFSEQQVTFNIKT